MSQVMNLRHFTKMFTHHLIGCVDGIGLWRKSRPGGPGFFYMRARMHFCLFTLVPPYQE